jgi:hypothetical protein
VFESGASLDAAQAVCGDGLNDGVEAVASSLLEKCSLLRVRTGRDGEPRLTMLDTVREFATQQHAAGEDLAELELRHARYFLDYCERTAERAARTAQREWLDLLGQERGNIGVAFQRLMERGLAEEALRLAVAFARALPWDAHAHRVRRWLQQALDASAELPAGRRAQGLYWAGMLALSQGLFADAHAQLAAALTLTSDAPAEAAVLCALGRCAVFVAAGDAGAVCDRALDAARAVGEPSLIAEAQLTAAGACERAESWERAGALAGVALELFRAAGDSYGAASALAEQAWYDIVHDRLGDAEPRLEEALELRRAHGDDRRLVEPLIDHAWLLHVRGAGEAAEAAFLECLALARHVGDRFIVGEALAGLSAQAALEARWSDAALLAGASAAMHGHIGAPPWASVTAIQERALAAARDALGELYAREFAAGGRLAAEEAVARTRAEPRRPAAIAGR